MPGIKLDHFILEPAMFILVGAKVSELISPEIFPFFAVFGLTFPYALLVFFIGILLRLTRGGWKGLVVPLIMLFFLQSSIALTIGGISGVPELTDDSSTISVGTFNVRRMDEYDWLEGEKTSNDILTWLSSTSLDIMCFQEMPVEMKGEVSKSLDGATVKYAGNSAGTAIATKLKIVDFKPWIFEDENYARGLILDVICPKSNDTIRVYNVHLQSVGLVSGDYDAVRAGPDTEQSKKLWSRLSSAYSHRSAQAQVLRTSIDSSPYPVILCGDFNDTPVSFALSTLRSGSPKLSDAFALAGSGLGSTYVGDIPGLRIDYMMSSSSLEVVSFETHEIELSDHRPISAVFISNR